MLSVIKNFVITFCISILIFGLGAYYVVNFALDSTVGDIFMPSETEDTEANGDAGISDTKRDELTYETDVNGDPIVPPSELNGSSFGILFIGVDYQPDIFDDYEIMPETEADESAEIETAAETEEPETEEGGFPKQYRKVNADSLTLVNISKETGQIVFLPIPSDTKVMYDGVYMKLGSLYYEYGGAAIAEKVGALTGFNVKYYAAITLANLEALVDALEGIEYNVPTDMVYDDDELDLHINLSRGTTVLSGEQAVGMLRYKEGGITLRRSVASGFLRAAIAKMLPITNPDTVEQMYTEFKSYIDTNYTIADIIANLDVILAYEKFRVVDISYPGQTDVEGNIEYFIPDAMTAIKNFKKYRIAD